MKNNFTYNPNRTRYPINQNKPLNTYERLCIGIVIGAGFIALGYPIILMLWSMTQ